MYTQYHDNDDDSNEYDSNKYDSYLQRLERCYNMRNYENNENFNLYVNNCDNFDRLSEKVNELINKNDEDVLILFAKHCYENVNDAIKKWINNDKMNLVIKKMWKYTYSILAIVFVTILLNVI